MKFTLAWANVLSQNMWLKFVIIFLTILSSILTVSTVVLSQKEPLIIDRECFSRAVKSGSTEHPPSEIETFLGLALSQRFDTKISQNSDLLSDDENSSRKQEQKELDSKGMSQKIIINSIKINSDTIFVDADRLISVGPVRSVLIFPLTVKIASVDRSQTNPYGLKILKVAPSKNEASSK